MYILSDKFILFFLAFFCSIDRLLMTEGLVKTIYVIAIISIILLMKIIVHKSINDKVNLILAYLILMVWTLTSNMWAKSVSADSTVVMIFVLFMALILVCKGLDEDELHFISIGFLLGGLIVCINLLTSNQYLNDVDGRLVLDGISDGGANDPNWLSWLLLPSLFTAIKFTKSSALLYKFLSSFCIMLIVYCIFLSGSRGAIMAIIVSFLCKWIYEKKYFYVFLSSTILIICSVFFIEYVIDLLGYRFDISFMIETGGAGRVDIWKVALEMIKDNFFCGVGVGNFSNNYQLYADEIGIGLSRGTERAVHNFVLQGFSELGFIGMVICFYVVYFSCKKNLSALLMTHEDFVWGGLALLLSAMFLTAFNEKMLWLFIGIVGSVRIGKDDS